MRFSGFGQRRRGELIRDRIPAGMDGSQRMTRKRLLFVLTATLTGCGSLAHAQSKPDYEQPPVSYSATEPRDAVAALQRRIASGELAFAADDREVLRTVLGALGVSPDTQVLVFSKTSLQRGRIRPDRPRALYFSDHVYVGWVPGGLIEITAVDPQLGPIFYSVEIGHAGKTALTITRDSDCLRCHGGTFVRDIPGVFARSLFPDDHGEPLLRHGSLVVEDETPFGDRWGGWYVTGYRGREPHRGNALASEQNDQLVFTPSAERPDELGKYFDASKYLRATSDVAALLVFEHQMTVQNSLTRAALSARKMIAYQHGLQKAFKETITDEPAYDSVKSVFASNVQDVLDRLLFRNAAPLPEGVNGSEAFRKAFAAKAPRSQSGHALKDLQLRDRIFEFRCSYLIYSDMFRALPESLKTRIFDRLDAALQSRDAKDRYAYIPFEERQRIREILIETHPDAKRRWSDDSPSETGGSH